jgi:hypothetical protein
MRLSRIVRALTALVLLSAIAGCSGVSYREHPTVSRTQYTRIENFSNGEFAVEQVDGLLEEVADILRVKLDATAAKVRIVVSAPDRISDLYRRVAVVAPHGADAVALYFPGASLVMIPYFDRTVLGHEFAHYLTDHYLKSTPRRKWESVAYMAYMVEDKLASASRGVARRPAPDVVARQMALLPAASRGN